MYDDGVTSWIAVAYRKVWCNWMNALNCPSHLDISNPYLYGTIAHKSIPMRICLFSHRLVATDKFVIQFSHPDQARTTGQSLFFINNPTKGSLISPQTVTILPTKFTSSPSFNVIQTSCLVHLHDRATVASTEFKLLDAIFCQAQSVWAEKDLPMTKINNFKNAETFSLLENENRI